MFIILWGKVIGLLCVVVGVFILVLFVLVIVLNFSYFYNLDKEKRNLDDFDLIFVMF